MDRTKKAKMKEYGDRHWRAQPSTAHEGDWILVRQEKMRKSDSQYNEYPLKVNQKGTMVTAVSDDEGVTENITHFKKCNTPPKQATSEVDSDVTEEAPTSAMRLGPPLSSAVGEPTLPTSAS
ncbi:hypothetical protein NDU88_010081 [Pleurodeles waltl]|uniref:Uncharacterized protein n=1 Tax=Pleurodeles waltl TaxID=8319 RepID=A0AAV7QWG5_PLEWA|nr:hypothetical protein NDU88_010081 [Pleurodeles waltl]